MRSWQELRIGDFITLEYGKPLEKSKRKEGGLYPAYGANGVKCWSDDYFYDKQTIIVGRKGSAGELTLTEDKFWPLDVTYFVKFDDSKFDLSFIYHLLSGLDLPGLATGVKPGINRNNVYDINVCVPDLREQKRIVAILDRAFSDIDRARELTEKNIQNARELFESYLQRIFSETGEGWTELVLKECVDTSCTLSYGIVQPGDDVPGGLPIVRPTDLTQKVITAENLKRIDPERASSYSRTSLRGGELLLCVRGTTGTVSKASEELDGANVTRGIVPIRFDQTLIDQDFGYYLLISKAIQGQVAEKTYGTALMQINIRDLKELKCPVPPKYIQPGLLANLMRAEGAVQHLESIYLKKLAALEELKKSLLQKAFSGELTAGEKIPVEEAAA